jgi:hypothetical protein
MARSVVALLFPLARRAQHLQPEGRLELCGMCGRDFVSPVEWEPVGPKHWRLLLRCGECETWRDVTVTNAIALRYDAEPRRQVDVLAALLDRLDRERMIGQAEAMTVALQLGLVDAADFATGRCGGSRASASSDARPPWRKSRQQHGPSTTSPTSPPQSNRSNDSAPANQAPRSPVEGWPEQPPAT